MEKTIIILHGWGLKGDFYKNLKQLLKEKGYSVYVPDLPGFGNESLKHTNMNLDDYVDFVENFRKRNKISKTTIIGHSFGGRIAIKYAWRYPHKVSKLILTGVPIIRDISLKIKTGFFLASIGGIIFEIFPMKVKNHLRKILYSLLGEWDYYNAGDLQKVFKNIIAENLKSYFQEIKVPTLLIWGENDHLVPLSIIHRVKKIRPDINLITVSNSKHNLPYKNAEKFFKAMEQKI